MNVKNIKYIKKVIQHIYYNAENTIILEYGVSNIRSDEDFRILRNRIIECICREVLYNKLTTFHGVDMIERCARSFLDQKGVDQYQFSGEHEYYKHILERTYRPLVERRFIQEYENNNFKIPAESRLHDICRRELSNKQYIQWDEIIWDS
jgi:hypothetical protein